MSAAAAIPPEGLTGKRALVSGGTRGIGAAIAARLTGAGAHATATGRHAADDLAGDDFIAADIATLEGTDAVIAQITERGGVDIIVHVAGGGGSAPSGGFAKLTPELWRHTLELNLLGAVRLDRGLLRAMIDAGAGAIVHIASIQRKMPLHDATLAYAAAKAALTTTRVTPAKSSAYHLRYATGRRPRRPSGDADSRAKHEVDLARVERLGIELVRGVESEPFEHV